KNYEECCKYKKATKQYKTYLRQIKEYEENLKKHQLYFEYCTASQERTIEDCIYDINVISLDFKKRILEAKKDKSNNMRLKEILYKYNKLEILQNTYHDYYYTKLFTKIELWNKNINYLKYGVYLFGKYYYLYDIKIGYFNYCDYNSCDGEFCDHKENICQVI